MESVFPVRTRPAEYVAFFNFIVPTKEGPGHVFMAVDGFSEFGFHLGVEPDASPDSVLKCIRILLRDPKLAKAAQKGFTLVLSEHEALSDTILAIVKPLNGRLMFDAAFNAHLAKPLLDDFKSRFLRPGK